jgi:DNA-binding NarL/FixJ family response regulator
MKKIRVLIADDHKMFRDGLTEILNNEKNITVVGETGDGMEIVPKVKQCRADVVLMDINMGNSNGIAATGDLLANLPDCRVLVLSMYSDSKYILSMLEAGAKGYILKNAGKEEVITAINTIARGDSYFSDIVTSRIMEQLSQSKTREPLIASRKIPITPREIEVLRLIAQEYSNAEIARKLFISIRTVDTHRRNLLEKLKLKNTAGLVKYAIKEGLLD